ncbi:MAG: hypothetical protein K0R49_1825, partial [Burkholderiales bacterium]|nr:hypothetical protein [Burkholderiales bacterium]
LKMMKLDMSAIRQEMYAGFTKGYLDTYNARLKTFDDYVKQYDHIRGTYSSLKEYSKGNFPALYEKSNLFEDALASSDVLVNNLTAIMPIDADAKSLMTYLGNMCGRTEDGKGGYIINIASMGDVDVVAKRMKCNLIIKDLMMNIAYRTLQTRVILLDYIATVLAARSAPNLADDKFFNENYPDLITYNASSSLNLKYADPTLSFESQPSAKEVVKITNEYLRTIRNIFVGDTPQAEDMFNLSQNAKNNKMFPLFEGFDTERLKSISSVCIDPRANSAGIVEWWPNKLEKDQNNKLYHHPYIVTNCPTGDNNDIAKGKTYYNDATKWNNILGVLVDADVKVDNHHSIYNASFIPEIVNFNSSKLLNTKFSLTSNVPLQINSMTALTLDNGGANTANLKLPNKNFVQANQYKPINPAYIFSGDKGPSYINLTDINSHVFGLSFFMYGFINTTDGNILTGGSSITLRCLDPKECLANISSPKITWNNGSSITMSQNGSLVSITANTKVNK